MSWRLLSPPESNQPQGFWAIEGDVPPFFPRQMNDNKVGIRKREKERFEKSKSRGGDTNRRLALPIFPSVFGPLQTVYREESRPEVAFTTEKQGGASEPRTARPLPQKRRRLQALEQDQPLPPPLRRGARIAQWRQETFTLLVV